jgi:hypothetical protein
MFICTLLIFGIAVFFAFRWLVVKHEKLVSEQRSDQQQYTTNLLNLTAEQAKATNEFSKVVERNTSAIESNTEILERCRMALTK